MVDYLTHPLIKSEKIQARIYQQMIFANAMAANTLVILPTGLGKTIIMIMMIAKVLNEKKMGKVVLIAPTRPLLDQHLNSMHQTLNIPQDDCVLISGETVPEKRKDLWDKAKIFICTPQTLRNDILSGYCDLSSINLMIFDESHRAVGDDPYVLPAKEYIRKNPSGHIVGFTASPGKKETIREILDNLKITNVEYMDESHPQVKPYLQSVSELWELLELPDELKAIQIYFQNFIKAQLQILKNFNLVDSIQISKFSRKNMLKIPEKLKSLRSELGDSLYFDGMRAYGQIMLASHGLEVLETQGIETLLSYYNSKIAEFKESSKKTLGVFLNDANIKQSIKLSEDLIHQKFIHPKVKRLKELVAQELKIEKDPRILVFANYKATVEYLVRELETIVGIQSQKFVGQTSNRTSKGLSQKAQTEIMEGFRTGTYNALVSTRVGEEGIDVAQCSLVIFYDMIPSGIRLIQRKGRTGRSKSGKVYYLIAKGTRDEGYYHASKYQKNRVKGDVKEVIGDLTPTSKQNVPQLNELDSFFDEPLGSIQTSESAISQNLSENKEDLPIVIIDSREKSSVLINALLELPVSLVQEKLEIGDVQISNRIGIERKTINDFCKSVIDRRLFDQLKQLSNFYSYPILILEGIYPDDCNLSENAFQGALLSVILDFNIQLIQTLDGNETAKLISRMVIKEQLDKKQKNISTTPVSGKDQYEKQIAMLSSIPNIDRTIAIRLMEKFRSIKSIVDAEISELRGIKGLGPIKAKLMKEFLTEKMSETGG